MLLELDARRADYMAVAALVVFGALVADAHATGANRRRWPVLQAPHMVWLGTPLNETSFFCDDMVKSEL